MSLFKDFCQEVFSIKNKAGKKIITILGIKFKFKNDKKLRLDTALAKKIQDNYDLSLLKKADKVILFFVPYNSQISGGVMSIFSICETSRELNPDWSCFISTYPGKYTYAKNDEFENDEKIYRWEQIKKYGKNIRQMILHIPEYYVKYLPELLKINDIKFFKSIPSLQINIMNQNIEFMPNPQELNWLKELTPNITQTIAHNAYATQSVCNKWGIPTHLLSCKLNIRADKYYYENKEKMILYSNDENIYKQDVLNQLQQRLPDFNFQEINGLTFEEFQDLIAKSFITITFGEGFDGYFLIPSKLQSLGMAVYNEKFFPDKSWLDLYNVFKDYDELLNSAADRISYLWQNKDEYKKLSEINRKKHDDLYNPNDFKDNLKRYYDKKYDFIPQNRGVL